MSPDPSKYLVRFGSPDCTDLHGAFFTSFTDYGARAVFPVKYNHGKDPVVGGRDIGESYVVPDAYGLRIGFNLRLLDDQAKAIFDLYAAGVLTWSAGSLSSEHVPVGGASWLRRFWIGEASLTPSPAEPWREPNPKVEPYTAAEIKANVDAQLSAPPSPGLRAWINHQRTLREQYNQYIEGLYHAKP